MKFYILFLSYLIVICSSIWAEEESFFLNTKPNKTIKLKYDLSQVKGKKVHTVYAFPNRAYYIYTSLDVSTLVNLPYPIKEMPINPAADIIKIEHKTGDNYFFIKPTKTGLAGIATNTHIICENGFSVLINICISEQANANQLVNILDGKKEIENKKYTKDFFKELCQTHKNTISQKDALISHLFFNKIKKYEIKETIEIEESKINLTNITKINDIFYYNLKLGGEKIYDIPTPSIVLDIQNYKNNLLSEQLLNRQVYQPQQIIYFIDQNNSEKRRITFVFKIKDPSTLFYSILRIGDQIIFKQKVNFQAQEINYDVFDVNI